MTVISDVICMDCCKMLDSYTKYTHKIKRIKKTFESFIIIRSIKKDDTEFKLADNNDIETNMSDEESLQEEYNSFHRTEQKVFTCPECNKKFNNKIIFNVHMKYVHNLPRDTPVICEVCGDQFPTKSLLSDHKNFCGDKKKFGSCRCEECGIEFKDIWRLQRHMRNTMTHNSDHLMTLSNYQKVSCDVCGKSMFKQKLRGHMRSHENKRGFACRCCSRKFNQRGILLRHMKVVHSDVLLGTRNVRCSICGEHFDRLNKYEVHMDAMHLNIQY